MLTFFLAQSVGTMALGRQFRMKELAILLFGTVSSVLASTPRVICTSSNPAELSGNVTLTCKFQADLDVSQITWRKDTQNMATYSEKHGIHIIERFSRHVSLNTTLTESSILITKLEKEDEGCYNCLFHTPPLGPFIGEVCLMDLKLVNKVLCNGQGNGLRIDLNPHDIQTRQSVQLSKKKIGATDFSTDKGQYLDPSIKQTCEFWLDKERVEENQNHSQEDADFVSIQCSASGTKKFVILWSNEGQPVNREDKENTAGNLITVTSTLIHTASSLPAGHRIVCTIKLNDPEIYDAPQQNSKFVYVSVTCAEALVFVILLLYGIYKATKKTETKTPVKPVELKTSLSSTKRLLLSCEWIDELSSPPPKFSIENEPGPAIPSSAMNEGNPFQP